MSRRVRESAMSDVHVTEQVLREGYKADRRRCDFRCKIDTEVAVQVHGLAMCSIQSFPKITN